MDASKEVRDHTFRIIVVGSNGSGKTSLVRTFVNSDGTVDGARRAFASQSASPALSESGVDLFVRSLDLPLPDGSILPVRLQILNPPGDPKFRNLTIGYFKGVQGIVVLYDVRNPDDNDIRAWLQDIEKNTNKKECVIFLVGTKIDSVDSKSTMIQVSSRLEDIFRTHSVPSMEVSAKEGHNVDALFYRMASLIYQKVLDPRMFHLDAMFNHDKDSGSKAPTHVPTQSIGSVDGDDGKMGFGDRISSYFKGKFKRQRRRAKQKLLQKVHATDVTVDNLYNTERDRFVEYSQRLKAMQERLRTMFSALGTAFHTGVQLGDDFRWCTKRSGPAQNSQAHQLIGSFSMMMAEGERTCASLYTELERDISVWTAGLNAQDGAAGSSTGPRPSVNHVLATLPFINQRMEQRERALLDFDAYRRKLRALMSKNPGATGKDRDEITAKLKKKQAKLLRSQETFEQINSALVNEFIACQDQRATYVSSQFLVVLKAIMKMFHAVGKSMDAIVPLVQNAVMNAPSAPRGSASTIGPVTAAPRPSNGSGSGFAMNAQANSSSGMQPQTRPPSVPRVPAPPAGAPPPTVQRVPLTAQGPGPTPPVGQPPPMKAPPLGSVPTLAAAAAAAAASNLSHPGTAPITPPAVSSGLPPLPGMTGPPARAVSAGPVTGTPSAGTMSTPSDNLSPRAPVVTGSAISGSSGPDAASTRERAGVAAGAGAGMGTGTIASGRVPVASPSPVSAAPAPAAPAPVVSFASSGVDALFAGDEMRAMEERVQKWELMKQRFQTFSLAHGFEYLHKTGTPPPTEEKYLQMAADVAVMGPQSTMAFSRAGRRASQYVRPPPPPAGVLSAVLAAASGAPRPGPARAPPLPPRADPNAVAQAQLAAQSQAAAAQAQSQAQPQSAYGGNRGAMAQLAAQAAAGIGQLRHGAGAAAVSAHAPSGGSRPLSPPPGAMPAASASPPNTGFSPGAVAAAAASAVAAKKGPPPLPADKMAEIKAHGAPAGATAGASPAANLPPLPALATPTRTPSDTAVASVASPGVASGGKRPPPLPAGLGTGPASVLGTSPNTSVVGSASSSASSPLAAAVTSSNTPGAKHVPTVSRSAISTVTAASAAAGVAAGTSTHRAESESDESDADGDAGLTYDLDSADEDDFVAPLSSSTPASAAALRVEAGSAQSGATSGATATGARGLRAKSGTATRSGVTGDGDEEEEEEMLIKVRALYGYDGQYEGDLSFQQGDVIYVYQYTEDSERAAGWWRGYCRGSLGFFPASYVEPIDEAEFEQYLTQGDPFADEQSQQVVDGDTSQEQAQQTGALSTSSLPSLSSLNAGTPGTLSPSTFVSALPSAASAPVTPGQSQAAAFNTATALSPALAAIPVPSKPPPMPQIGVAAAAVSTVPVVTSSPSSSVKAPPAGAAPAAIVPNSCKEASCNCKGFKPHMFRPLKCNNCPHLKIDHEPGPS